MIVIKMLQPKKKISGVVFKFCAAVGILGLIIYPIIISPMMDSSTFKEIQKVGRQGINQEEIQPGNMKVWSDPFKSKK